MAFPLLGTLLNSIVLLQSVSFLSPSFLLCIFYSSRAAGPLFTFTFIFIPPGDSVSIPDFSPLQIKMKFLNVLLLSVAGTALAKGHKEKEANHTMSVKAQCGEVAKLTKLTELANNQTELDAKTKNDAAKATKIKDEATKEAPKLAALQANATLMTQCNQIFSVEATERDCGKIAKLEKLNDIVGNATKLDEHTKNNATKAAELKAKASADAGTLAALQSNATLTAFCSVEKTKEDCKAIKSLQKEIDLAGNATALDDKFKGNQTKIAEFQKRADKAKTKLAALQANATLTSECAALKKGK